MLASTGQVTLTSDGARFVPSEATMTLTSSGMFIRVTCAAVPSNSSSQRSEPAGFGPAVAAALSFFAAGAGVGVPVVSEAPLSEPPLSASAFGVTTFVVSFPVAFW